MSTHILKKPSASRREHHNLAAARLGEMTAEYLETGRIPNPYSYGVYFAFIEALKTLGVNQIHSFSAVKDQMRQIMSRPETQGENGKTAWQRFSFKREVKFDCNGRIIMNAEMLQRVNEYGLKLLQVGQQVLRTEGMVVDILRGRQGSPMYRLNTNSAQPINELRRKRKPS